MLDITKIQHHTELMQRCLKNHLYAQDRISELEDAYSTYYDVNSYGAEMKERNDIAIRCEQTLITQLKLTVTEFNDILKTL